MYQSKHVIIVKLYHFYIIVFIIILLKVYHNQIYAGYHSSALYKLKMADQTNIKGGGLGFSAPDFKVNLLNVPKY